MDHDELPGKLCAWHTTIFLHKPDKLLSSILPLKPKDIHAHMIPQWLHTHTSQSVEYSMAITQSIPSYCHSHLLPFLITAPSWFSLSLTSPSAFLFFPSPPLQPSSLFPRSPFFLLYRLSFHANKNEQNSWGRRWVVGRQVGWNAFTPVWCPLSLRQHVRSLKGHRVVSVHLTWLKRRSDFAQVHIG